MFLWLFAGLMSDFVLFVFLGFNGFKQHHFLWKCQSPALASRSAKAMMAEKERCSTALVDLWCVINFMEKVNKHGTDVEAPERKGVLHCFALSFFPSLHVSF